MQRYICTTCGTQYPLTDNPPAGCAICEEQRQFVNPVGQSWTTLDTMRGNGEYANEMQQDESGLYSITTTPRFAIGQTAYLVQDADCPVLWDCISFLDDQTVEAVKQAGGIQAIALSHPHYYSSQVEWAEAFNVPIYIHEADRHWVMPPSDHIRFWSGEDLNLSENISLHRLGGHFAGGSVLHWADGNDDKGVLLTGDIIQVAEDRRWVSFMYSYPNMIPLPAAKVAEIARKAAPLRFDRIYNAFHTCIHEDANAAVQRSAVRYIAALEGKLFRI